jgi:hypothetical protein
MKTTRVKEKTLLPKVRSANEWTDALLYPNAKASNCCGARVVAGRCTDCKEMCEEVGEE